APALADSHRPEAYAVQPLVTDGRGAAPPPADAPRRVALRAVRPPLALEVFCRRDQPDFIRPAVASAPLACSGRVVSLAGPWRLQGEWWPAAPLQRDYFDAQLTDGGVYRVYFDRQAQRWFLDGSYD